MAKILVLLAVLLLSLKIRGENSTFRGHEEEEVKPDRFFESKLTVTE